MAFLFKKDFWESAGKGLSSLVSGDKKARTEKRRDLMKQAGIQPTGKTVFEMDKDELWKTGLGNALAGATGDLFAKSKRGQLAKRVGEEIADKVIKPARSLPGVSQIGNAEKVVQGVLGGPKKMAELAVEEIKNKGISNVLGQVQSVIPQGIIDRAKDFIPSMATGGIVRAPPRRGKLVRLHNKELVIPARKSKAIQRLAKRNGIEIPIRRR
jgi:hypothetical protein